MSRLGLIGLLAFCWTGPAEAAVMNFTCSAGGTSYTLTLDDDAGTMVSVLQGKETVYGVRGIKREGGTLTVNGYVSGRGTDYVLVHRYSTSITYTFGNGGKRVDSCSGG